MKSIPKRLVDSLKEFGLLESEAKIYSALVIRHDSEVKELQEFLGMSKPSVYEGLRTLEEKGFVILINPRPTTYQAIPPEVALDMRLTAQMKAKEETLASIRELKGEQSDEKRPRERMVHFRGKTLRVQGQRHAQERQEEHILCHIWPSSWT